VSETKKPWGGRFSKSPSAFLDEFGASLPVDRRMWAQDIRGSIAHARMLAATQIITQEDADAIEAGLSQIYREIGDGEFEFRVADEDIHMAIERVLTERVGPAGGRLHTARSRNDQVALDTRMYTKDVALDLLSANGHLRTTIVQLAEEHLGTVMPGYTHLQRAQPVLFSHHLLAYFWMLTRDAVRLQHAYDAADVMPLGSAALAGTTFGIDRVMLADVLGFESISPNSMDAVSDRDFLLDITYACAVSVTHLSRMCEELILWSSEEFGFVTMDDSYSTGSSIMPQKKNPDFAELVRGKTGRVNGDLVALLTMLKGLPLAYNKDMQEDKEAAFDAVDTLQASLVAVEGMLSSMVVNSERMLDAAHGGFMAATDLADYLVGKGIAFREAHEVVGRIVLELEQQGRTLQDLSASEFAAYHPSFGDAALDAVDINGVVSRRTSQGGTGTDAVVKQISVAREILGQDCEWLEAHGGA
jgi:argininosuccinate lyase